MSTPKLRRPRITPSSIEQPLRLIARLCGLSTAARPRADPTWLRRIVGANARQRGERLKRISRRISDEKGSLSGCLREPIGHLPCRSNASRKRVALVTGSSSGIGRGLAIAVAREGVKVVVNYPDDSQAANARAVVAEIERLGGRALSVRADVSVEDEARSIVEATMTTFQIVKQTLPGRLETRSSPRAITRRAGARASQRRMMRLPGHAREEAPKGDECQEPYSAHMRWLSSASVESGEFC
jgi:hypothetical protein